MEGQKTLLRHLRREREISIATVAKATGINAATISLIERLLVSPTPEQRERLAAYFDRAADELLAPYSAAA